MASKLFVNLTKLIFSLDLLKVNFAILCLETSRKSGRATLRTEPKEWQGDEFFSDYSSQSVMAFSLTSQISSARNNSNFSVEIQMSFKLKS